jgi:ATP-dependent Clp protease protease subunit
MKKVLPFIALIMLTLMIGCAGTPTIPQEPIKHTLDINISSDSGKPVTVKAKDPLQERIMKSMEIQNTNLKLSQLSAISKKTKKAYIKIFSGLSVADVTRAWGDIIYLYDETDIRDLNVFINSPGGDAFSGLALSNMIQMARGMGFKVTAHASGIIASAAIPVLAVCDVRIAAKDTILMVHEAALWKWPGRETASDIRAQGELMALLKERYLNILASDRDGNTKLPYDKWEVMEVKTKWFNTTKALEWGLIDKIVEIPPRNK